MEMRYMKDIVIERAIIHILDPMSDKPLLNNYEIEISDLIYSFLQKKIVNTLCDYRNSKGKIYSPDGQIYNLVSSAINDNNNFIESSKLLSEKLFKVMKRYGDMPACDLLICKFHGDSDSFLAIIKLDHKSNLNHKIDYDNDVFKISLVTNEIGLPDINQKISDLAVFKNPSDDYYDAIYSEKPFITLENERISYFSKEFLNCSNVIDDTESTMLVKNQVEKWVRKYCKDNIDKAIAVREMVSDVFINSGTLKINDLVSDMCDCNIEKEMFLEDLNHKGLDIEGNISIDKKWVDKAMKAKQIKVDTGFTIKGDYDFFNDSMRFETKYNGDGSVNFIIKNVRCFSEK